MHQHDAALGSKALTEVPTCIPTVRLHNSSFFCCRYSQRNPGRYRQVSPNITNGCAHGMVARRRHECDVHDVTTCQATRCQAMLNSRKLTNHSFTWSRLWSERLLTWRSLSLNIWRCMHSSSTQGEALGGGEGRSHLCPAMRSDRGRIGRFSLAPALRIAS